MSDRDVLDEVLGIGCMFDLVTPLAAMIQTVTRGGGVTLEIPLACGLGRDEVRTMLRQNGIDCWGLQYVDDHILYVVRREDAHEAEMVFAGIGAGDGGRDMFLVHLMLMLGALTGLTGYLWWVGVI